MSEWLHNWLTQNLSDDQLQELRANTYDRWTWDTGEDADRRLFDALDEECERRSVPPATLNFIPGANVVITMDTNDDCITLTMREEYIQEQEQEPASDDSKV